MEETGGDGAASPIHWEKVENEDEDPPPHQTRPFPFHARQEGDDVPPNSMEAGRTVLSGPSEQEGGSKWQRADEVQPGQVSQPQNANVGGCQGELEDFLLFWFWRPSPWIDCRSFCSVSGCAAPLRLAPKKSLACQRLS